MDMESIKFPECTFDAIISVGSLSYGDNKKVLREIYEY